ncbi:FAD/NAD(P)-binding protein [Sphingobacterium bambusae]|uniref:FAD/NAD(P)-binding protein n=1 Tax=Sphingobacterium bambusae TaxID=662858 RepID=A0ABW6BI18_9SPHI|nr:FAD/NAD(P)-binding protein [Sphingobacterium bambusae]WPL49099.1 FAD/NAD(P)-binding protein [Sphingobacterium bambusae]
MKKIDAFTSLAIIGGGPMALLLIRRLLDHFEGQLAIELFEKQDVLGAGMPYSHLGAEDEHIANISANELPEVLSSLDDWIKKQDSETLERFAINAEDFNEHRALPRLLLGSYLADEFSMLIQQCKVKGFSIEIHYRCAVIDIIDEPENARVRVVHQQGRTDFDKAIICSGHLWPKMGEGDIPNYFDSPYPPAKLVGRNNYSVAIRGASLTAVDAIRTLARNNGHFYTSASGAVCYSLASESKDFKLVMHSRAGLLPAVRFHLADTQIGRGELLSAAHIERIKAENGGFVPLDYLYEHVFLRRIEEERPSFHQKIEELTMEDFVEKMMEFREDKDPFELLEREYREAARSIIEQKSIYWKEMLAVLSYTMNYPAKYFCAEDMLRLEHTLKPLISIVIAFVPQHSVEELLALHAAGILSLVEVGEDSRVEPLQTGGIRYHYKSSEGKACNDYYAMFVDCVGQPVLSIADLHFKSLKERETVAPAVVKFKSYKAGQDAYAKGVKGVGKAKDGHYYMQLPGVAINDHFQITDMYGKINERIYMLAVPFIGGFNPDYSGLDFVEEASLRVVQSLLS